MKRFILLFVIALLAFSSALAGAYERETLNFDYKQSSRAFYKLARVDAKNASGTRLMSEGRVGFAYNGCILVCIYPPEKDGKIIVELNSMAFVANVEDLSFDIKKIDPPKNSFISLRDFEGTNSIDYALYSVKKGQRFTVLAEIPNYRNESIFYFAENSKDYGFIPKEYMRQKK